MKNLQKAISAITLSVATMLSAVGCMDNSNVRNDYLDGQYNYPYQGPQHMLVRVPKQGGNVEYVTTDQPVTEEDVKTRYAGARYKSMRQNQTIDQQTGYQRVQQSDSGMYFVQHNPNNFVQPNSGPARQTSYWWNTSYGCGMNVGYWNYNAYCNYGWNHYYAPYSYSWYYNWSWAPTYYSNNAFWYFSPGWSNLYTWGGYNYYYFNMRFW